jgi:hypothetical protein
LNVFGLSGIDAREESRSASSEMRSTMSDWDWDSWWKALEVDVQCMVVVVSIVYWIWTGGGPCCSFGHNGVELR